jgi:outer membrane protein TolC
MHRGLAKTTAVALMALVLFVAGGADAQQQPAQQQPAQQQPPAIDDPMLKMPARPKRTIRRLEDALSLMRARSTDLRIAYDEIDKAEGQWRSALATTLPVLSAQGGGTHQIITKSFEQPVGVDATGAPVTKTVTLPTRDVGIGGVSLTQPLFALQAWHTIGSARLNEDLSRKSVDDVKRGLLIKVNDVVVAAVTAERLAEVNRLSLKRALDRLDITQRRKALGATSGIDVTRAEADVEDARSDVVLGDEKLRRSWEALGLALGLSEPIAVALDLDALEKSTAAACHATPNVEARADLQVARVRLELAERAVATVDRGYFPIVALQSSVASTTADTKPAPATTWLVQGVVTVPIWDGGARYGDRRAAVAMQDEASQLLEGLRRSATIEVIQARRAVAVAEETFRVATASRNLVAEVDRLTQAAWRSGQGSSLELILAATNLRQADLNLTLRQFDLVRARLGALLTLANCDW